MQNAYQNELVYYRKYHKHPVNWWIHAITVPCEYFALLLGLTVVNLHYPASILLGIYQFVSVPNVGIKSVCAIVNLIMICAAEYVTFQFNSPLLMLSLALFLQVLSWFAQVYIGHYQIEKNQPGIVIRLTLNSVVLSLPIAWDSNDHTVCI